MITLAQNWQDLDSNSAALHLYLSEQDAAEILQERYEAMFPAASFTPEAERLCRGECLPEVIDGFLDRPCPGGENGVNVTFRLLEWASGQSGVLDSKSIDLMILDQKQWRDYWRSAVLEKARELQQAYIRDAGL